MKLKSDFRSQSHGPRSRHMCYAMLLMLSLGGQSLGDESRLRWKFTPNETWRVQVLQTLLSETTISAKSVKMQVDLTLDLDWRVDAVDGDGNAEVSQTFRRVSVKFAVPMGGVVAFDSDATTKPSAEAREIAATIKPLIGKKVTCTLTPRGEVREVSWPKESEEALQALASTKSQAPFSLDQLRQILRQTTVVFPEQAVKPGDHWEQRVDVESPLGKVRQSLRYDYAAKETRGEREVTKIEVTGQIELKGAKELSIKDQKLTGTLYFDIEAGRLVESTLQQTLQTQSQLRETVINATITSTLQLKVQKSD